jgi:hypothetical protein
VTAYVLDSSVTPAWCFEDEATPATDGLLDQARLESVLVPGLWPLEIGNILALREGLPLATRDAELAAAATRLAVPVLP